MHHPSTLNFHLDIPNAEASVLLLFLGFIRFMFLRRFSLLGKSLCAFKLIIMNTSEFAYCSHKTIQGFRMVFSFR